MKLNSCLTSRKIGNKSLACAIASAGQPISSPPSSQAASYDAFRPPAVSASSGTLRTPGRLIDGSSSQDLSGSSRFLSSTRWLDSAAEEQFSGLSPSHT
jgi:hypothetical protein